ncbi:MAG: crossover junction endodeoxyribonuclease RuvC [Planctomycetes bacterium]|nr:crossover junction endodeoxyribonuclease RuvC [Planctomycetota bacterium]
MPDAASLHSGTLLVSAPVGVCRILGVDPGLRVTGYALVEPRPNGPDGRLIEAGLVRLTPKIPIEQRLVELDTALAQLLDNHRPTALVCEQLYAHYKHPRTAILMGHARGVILTVAAKRGLRVMNVAATHVKRALTGNGHASKAQMQRAVMTALRLAKLPTPHDVSDAIAIAVCGLRMSEVTGGVQR